MSAAMTKAAQFDLIASELVATGKFFAQQGWSSATSSNYSARLSADTFAITRTGVDKYYVSPGDIVIIDKSGVVLEPPAQKSSAETLIHTTIYTLKPEVGSVLHTHSPFATRLSLKYATEGAISFSGYEMQKAFHGVTSHETELRIPILPNSQDMAAFAKDVYKLFQQPLSPNFHGFLMSGHGLYTWAPDIKTARRHIEAFEFLFHCRALELQGV